MSRHWLPAVIMTALGSLGGIVGAIAGGAAGIAIGVETAPNSGIPAHEDLLGAIRVILRAAVSGAVGAVVGAIIGSVSGSLAGAWTARKVSPPAGKLTPNDTSESPKPESS